MYKYLYDALSITIKLVPIGIKNEKYDDIFTLNIKVIATEIYFNDIILLDTNVLNIVDTFLLNLI